MFSSLGLTRKLVAIEGEFASHIGCLHDAPQTLAPIGRQLMSLVEPLARYHEFRLRLEHNQIRI